MWHFVSVFALLLGAIGLACGAPVDREALTFGAPNIADTLVEVHVERVYRGAISQPVFAPGSLMARRVSRIGAEVPGRIEKIVVRSGDRVEKGALLFQIDPAPYAAVLRQAESGLDLARAQRKQLAADLARLAALRSDGVSSESEFERAKTAVAVARARERQASEAVAMARLDLKRTRVFAPYAGSISERLVDEGTTALAQPQTIVVVIQETTELEALADVAERERAVVNVGDPALVHVDPLADAIATTVTSVSDTIDPATRTYRVRMRIPNHDHRLKAGVFARIEIHPAGKSAALLIPRDVIRSEDAESRVLVVRDGRAESVTIQLGLLSHNAAEVVAGLSVGDEIVTGKAAKDLAPGIRVRIVKTDAPPDLEPARKEAS